MRKIIALVAAALLCTTYFASCNSDSDTTELSPDCAINSIVMGTLERDYHTWLESGKDTSYKITVPGSSFPLHIDQINLRIFNSDSLPMGTNLKKIYFTTFSCDGISAYRLESGNDTVYSTSDTIDFSTPRIFTIYSADGTATRSYTITINVHNSDPDAFSWTQAAPASNDLAALTSTQLLESNSTLYLWGEKDGTPILLTRSTEGKQEWNHNEISAPEGFKPKTVSKVGNRFAAICNDGVAVSEDGKTWTAVETGITPSTIIAVNGSTLYVAAEGKVYSSEDLTTWTEESIDDDAKFLPTENVCSAVMPALNNSNISNIVCVGYANSQSETWKKECNLAYPEDNAWSHYPITEETPRTLPYFSDMSMVRYDDNLYAYGVDGDSAKVYISVDGARTWDFSTLHSILPENIGKPSAICSATDSNGNVWLACQGTGLLWKGYLNRLKADKNN